MSGDEELREALRRICGEHYGKGASAEEVLSALDDVRHRFEALQEVEA